MARWSRPDRAERRHRPALPVRRSGANGCGLGLAIVREIVQGHNADVQLAAGAHDSATLVTVAFPRTA